MFGSRSKTISNRLEKAMNTYGKIINEEIDFRGIISFFNSSNRRELPDFEQANVLAILKTKLLDSFVDPDMPAKYAAITEQEIGLELKDFFAKSKKFSANLDDYPASSIIKDICSSETSDKTKQQAIKEACTLEFQAGIKAALTQLALAEAKRMVFRQLKSELAVDFNGQLKRDLDAGYQTFVQKTKFAASGNYDFEHALEYMLPALSNTPAGPIALNRVLEPLDVQGLSKPENRKLSDTNAKLIDKYLAGKTERLSESELELVLPTLETRGGSDRMWQDFNDFKQGFSDMLTQTGSRKIDLPEEFSDVVAEHMVSQKLDPLDPTHLRKAFDSTGLIQDAFFLQKLKTLKHKPKSSKLINHMSEASRNKINGYYVMLDDASKQNMHKAGLLNEKFELELSLEKRIQVLNSVTGYLVGDETRSQLNQQLSSHLGYAVETVFKQAFRHEASLQTSRKIREVKAQKEQGKIKVNKRQAKINRQDSARRR